MCFPIKKSRPTNKHIYYYYRPPMKLQESKVFTSMCLFTGGCISGSLSHLVVVGGYVWSHVPSGRMGMHGPKSLSGGGYTRGWAYWKAQPLEGTHPRRHTPWKIYPRSYTPSDSHGSGWYTSYLNSFLFLFTDNLDYDSGFILG